MLPRSGCPLRQRLLGAQVVAGGEVLAARRQDHHADGVVGLGAAERLVELNQQAAALRVVGFGPVEPDPGDAALVEGFVGHQLVALALAASASACSETVIPPPRILARPRRMRPGCLRTNYVRAVGQDPPLG